MSHTFISIYTVCLGKLDPQGKKCNIILDSITCDPSIYTMDRPDLTVLSFTGNSICTKQGWPTLWSKSTKILLHLFVTVTFCQESTFIFTWKCPKYHTSPTMSQNWSNGAFSCCGRPWPAAYININQNTHQIQVLTEALCRAQAIFY